MNVPIFNGRGGLGIPRFSAKRRAPVLSAALKVKAQKIINAANGYTPRTVMATPPTITRSVDFATSTVGGGDAGAPSISPNDARIRKTAPLINQFSAWYGGWQHDDIQLDGGDGWGFGIKTNSRILEISLGFGNNYQIQLRVNGQWMAATDTALFSGSPSFNPRFITFDFGSTATRTIEWFLRHSQDIRGINLSAGATLALPDTTGTEVWGAMYGDSFVEANGGLYQLRTNMCQLFGETMGMPDIIPCGRANQGYVLARDSRTISSRMVTDAPLITSPTLDIIYAHGSVNDYNQSAATIQANVQTGIAGLMAAQPNAWIVFFSSFNTQNNHIDATRNAAFRDGALAAAAGDPRVIVLDTQALGWPVVSATSGLNSDGSAHDSADGIHGGPNDVNNMVKNWMKPAVVSALQALIA